ncbi:calcium-binding protein [Fibrobacter sp. UWH5]|uniref:calcium-binding protein n=1 Tax=Fibrobacter sp. UWH5 TaxID=1896211 RepID=UPI00111470AD|nr:calcium-binding protein [Fibrobacter sp. UWH5]
MPKVVVSGDDLLQEDVRLFGKNDAQNTNRLELSISDVVDKVAKALKDGVLKNLLKYGEMTDDELDAIPKDSVLDVLNQQLPLFGKSAPELLGLINKLNDTIGNITKNHPATLQELCQRVNASLGADLFFEIKDGAIDFSFVWIQNYSSQRVGINNFAILDALNVGGAAEVYLNGMVEAQFDFSMSTGGTALGSPELKEGSFVNIDVSLIGKPLSFDLTLNVGGMTPPLMKVVSSDANPSYIRIEIKENISYEKSTANVTSGEEDSDSEEPKVIWKLNEDACKIGGKLRIECAGLDVGEIKLGVVNSAGVVNAWTGAGAGGNFTMADIVNGKVGVRLPDALKDKQINIGGSNAVGSVVLDFSGINTNWEKFDLFGQVRLVADALSAALRKAQSSLNKTFLSDGMRKIPLVGDSIVGAADCLTALDEKFIEPFRKFAYNSQNLDAAMVAERLYTILQKTGLLLALDKKVLFDTQNNCTQKVMWAGSLFDQVFSDKGNQYIQYRDDGNCVEWRFRLGNSYTLSGNADFDLGMPGLGLSSKGGVGLELSLDWYIGFGVSKTGAYIMLSKGDDADSTKTEEGKTIQVVADGITRKVKAEGSSVEEELLSGDDIRVSMTVMSDHLGLEGALGFLKMKADVKDGSGNAYGTNPKVKAELATFTFGIDLNDGKNGSDDAKNDSDSDISCAETKISTDNIASALSLETNLDGGLDLNIVMTLGFDENIVDIGFPTIGTTFHLKWAAAFGQPFGSLEEASFSDIKLDLGSFVNRTLKPVLNKIQKVIDPIMPLIDFLQSEIPVLSSLPKGGSKMTVLNLIKSIGSAKGVNLGMIDDIVKVANLVKKIDNVAKNFTTSISVGSLNLFTSDASKNGVVSSFLSGTAALPLGDFVGRLAGGDAKNAIEAETKTISSSFDGSSTSGWFFPLFQDEKTGKFELSALKQSAINLLFGQNIDLVKYRMSPLIFDFDWSKSFPIVGPLCADIGLNFGAKIELSFGYDTRGLISWKKTGFKDLWALADGFFIDDLDSNGKDVSEVIFYSGITAGASVAGRAGINVGVNLNLNLNLDDPNNDGKLRLSELADSLAHSPFAIFDASVTLQARAYAYLDLVFYRQEFDLWKSGALELFNTDKKGSGTPIVATTQEGNLVVNVGEFAEKRVYGDLSDGDDTVDIVCSEGTVDITIKTADKVSTKSSYTLAAGKCVYIYAKDGKDKVSITGNSSLNFVIDGGNGNDEIDLSGLTLLPNCYALVMGGLGDDFIRGADIGTNILLGETADVLYKKKKSSDEEYVALVNAYPNSSNPGNNVIVGGRGKNYIVGGGGSDLIVGGVDAKLDNKADDGTVLSTEYFTENYLYGDFAYFEFDESHNLTNAKNEDLYDEGGNDVILGSSKTDFIFGGAGSDRIKGGDGNDEIHGGKGNDVIYGGAGNDKIYGEDGVDVIFGDTPADEAMVIAREDDAVGELPYVYIAEEIKKDTSDLFGSDSVTTTDADGNVSSESVNRIALFNFENSFKTDVASLNALAQVAVSLFDAPQVDLSATQTAATTGATTTGTTAATEAEGTEPQAEEEPSTQVTNGSDVIEGGNGSDIIFGDDGSNTSEGGSDIISGGADNDFIDGDGGNDTINGDYGEDIIYGGLGNDTLDGGAGNDFVFGDNGLAGYVKDNNGAIIGASELFKNSFSGSDDDKIAKANQDLMFGYGITAFAKNFGITADAKFNGVGGNDTILAGNGNDFVDGQGGDDTYKIQIMGGSNHAITNVMDSGTADKGDSMTIDGTVEADDMLVRASTAGLGFVAKLPSKKDAQIERVNFWNVGGGDTGLENIAINTGAGDDKIAIDGTLSTISIDAGAGNDTITVGQQFESERNTDKDHSNVLPNDAFTTTKTTQGYLSAGVQHSTSIVGGEGNDTFNVLHNEAAVSLSGGLGNDTFNVAMFQKVNNDGSKSIVENGPVTLIGGAGVDKMSIVGSDGDDDFVISQGRVLCNGIDVQAVSIENKNVYGGDGDDSFYVLDTAKDEVTKLYGNKGNDSFYNGGIGTAKEPENIGNSKNDDSNAIGVLFYNENAANYDDIDNRIDTAKNTLDEGAAAKTVYKIALSKQPQENEVVSVTIFAPGETTEKLNRGDRGIWLVDGNGNYCKSITYKFAKTAGTGVFAWNALVDVKLVAIGDSVREGNDYFSLLHNVSSTQTNAKIKDCKNALVFLKGMSGASLFVQQQYHVVNATESASGSIALSLIETPITGSIECWYEKGSVRQTISTFAVNNSNLTISVSPAALETNGYIFVKYKVAGDANKVQNMFAITQEHVLASQEIDESKILWYLQALPEKQNIDCWYMKDGSPVQVPETCLDRNSSNNELTIDLNKMRAIPAVGTRFYISYKFEHMLVVNESVIQMSNSTEGMTELLAFVPVDEVNGGYVNESYLICAESEIRNYPQCRYCYRTAGTQLIICSVRSDGTAGQPVPMYGNIAFAWQSLDSENGEKHYPSVVIEDEKDSFENVSPADVMKNIAQNTIENIKGALYEDGMGREADLGIDGPSMLHYDGLDADGNRLTTSNDEKNVISESDLAERKAAEEEAAKFDEGNCKDRIFVNNRKNNRAGIKNDIDALSEIAKFDNSMIEKDVDPALILQKTEDVVKQADTEWHDSDEHSLRFEHQDASSTATSQFNLANMEYGEINLGSGADKVDINKTIYREDGFQTFTVVNTGAGKDNINVHSYAREKSTVLGTLSGLTKTTYSGSLKNVIAYSVSGFTFSNGVTSDNLKAIVAQNNDKLDRGLLAQNRVFLNVEYSDGTIQRREVFLEDNDETTVTTLLLKRELTPVAQDVSIVAMYLANGYDGDGLLVVNAQGGDDTINAVGDVDADGKSKVTREGMVVIGGVGNDTIDVNTNVIAIGDRGQIVYENEKSEIVTRLGSLDIENSETDDAKLNAADYTTPADKTASNYFQTDGVVRDAKYIHSVSETVGGNDVITAHGDKNVAIGGAGSDEIYLNGENNVAVGDNGEVKFAGSDVVKNASGDVVDHVYGDSSTTYLNYVQSTSDAHGAIDTITTQNGKNVVIGGTDSDMIATGSGNDVIVGDGGEVYVDRNRDALLVDNVGRNVDGSAGSDVIKTSGGDNVILGGLNTKSRDFDFVRNAESGKLDKMSIDKNNDDLIESGDGKDVVFGDNAYVTFKGNSEMAEGFDNMPTIYTEATLSFNFQGPAQSGIGANEQAGAVADYRAKSVDETTGETVEITEHADYCVGNWNNIKSVYGRESGTYGNDDNEIVLFDNGTRASAVSVTYGATESHRISTTDGENIRLRGYDQTPYVHGSNSGDVNLMKSGLDISGNNGRNTLITQVDGLSQYFTEYEVVVYLDMVREISMHENSVRVVKLYIDSVDENGKLTSTFFDEFYVNDPDTQTFNGTWNVATGKSVATATLANCVVFKSFVENDTKHTLAGDRFHIEITDPQNGTNGKDRAGIAGIQVHGFMHKQDVAASTDIDMGGKDVILTNGGDDIVVGGTGNDTITTFGDDRYGIRDNDIVYGDNAKMVFTDRDSDPTTATTISHAESIATTNLKASYDDIINTGDGNDVVVGGVGHDVVNSNATSGAEAKMDNIQVTSFNFVTETTSDSLLIHAGESAGVVVDNDWHNVYLRNNQMRDRATGNESAPSTVITFEYTSIGNYGNRNNPNEQIDPATGDDMANNKMLKTLVMGQRQETLSLTLHNLPGPSGSPCDVYVYVGGKLGSSDGYDYVFEINGSDNQKFYLNDWIGNSFEGEYKEVTCKDYKPGKLASGVTPNVEMIGNYVVFRNVKTCDYTVQIRCVESTLGNQYPNDIPVFSGVQVVSGLNRTGDIALGGDHDKDLVFGDEASLDFDLDIPFAGNENIKDYKNRVISAESMALATEAVQHLRTDDEIKTGKDRDVVVGGEGRDTISTGSGDDVAIGDNAKLMVENNNPIGVFQPDVEVVLEDNQYFDGYKEAYLDNDQVNEQRMMQKFYEGKIVGIQLQDSENGRLDSIDVGAGENLVFEQSRSEEQLFVGTLESDEDEDDVNPSDIGGEGSEGTEGEGSESGEGSEGTESGEGSEGTETGEGSEGTEQIAMKQFVLSQKHVPVYVEIAAGETVEIVITDWEEGNPYYRPKVVLEMNSLDNMMHHLDISWDGISEAITRDLLNYNWLEIPNSSTVPGEHKIVLQIHSDEAIAFLASCGI